MPRFEFHVTGTEESQTFIPQARPFDEVYVIEAAHVAEALALLVGVAGYYAADGIEWGILDPDRAFEIEFVPSAPQDRESERGAGPSGEPSASPRDSLTPAPGAVPPEETPNG